MQNSLPEKKATVFKSRLAVLAALFCLAFAVVLCRLVQLQIVRHGKYEKLAKADQSTAQMVPALRGPIHDRHGNTLAEDRPFYDLSVRADRLQLRCTDVDAITGLTQKYRGPQSNEPGAEAVRVRLREQRDAEFEKLSRRVPEEPFVKALARTVNRSEEEVAAGLQKALHCLARGWATPRTPLRIVSGVDEQTWLGLRAVHEDVFRDSSRLFGKSDPDHPATEADRVTPPFPGLVCTISTRRVYPHGSLACFALGALGELSPAEEETLRQDGVLLDNAAARARYWERLRDDMDDKSAARLEQVLRVDPRDIRSLGELHSRLAGLRPSDRDTAAALGLAEPVRWSERPPRMQLTEPEMLWLGVGLPTAAVHNTLPSRAIGELGVERIQNDRLRGKSGMKLRDSLDEEDDQLSFRRNSTPREGDPLALTISLPWQKAAENALKSQEKCGAIVVLDTATGEVLALASWPDFDPNLFSPPRDGKARQEKLRALLSDPRKPLLDRAIAEQYPLGSIMKTLVAAVALEKGLVNTTETFECPGYIVEGGQKFRCDETRAHGTVNLLKCIRCSCNVTAMQIGARVGVEGFSPYARALFGHRTGIDLPGEAPGVFPDRAWRTKAYPQTKAARVWTKGNDYLLSIGQGQLSVTVMQTAVLMAAVSNGGYVVTPHLWLDSPAEAPRRFGISPASLAVVRQGLEEVVNVGRPGERGTAYSPFHEGPELAVRVAGKTSTAEHHKGDTPHAWFAGYAPADNPQVAFAILLEEGGHGGAAAAPLAYRMLREVYGTRAAPNRNPGGPNDRAAGEEPSPHALATGGGGTTSGSFPAAHNPDVVASEKRP